MSPEIKARLFAQCEAVNMPTYARVLVDLENKGLVVIKDVDGELVAKLTEKGYESREA